MATNTSRLTATGRDLDALVAETIMGWRHTPHDDWPPMWRIQDHVYRDEWVSPDGVSLGPWAVPAYSSDITAAWQVVQKFDSYHMRWNAYDKEHEAHLIHYHPEQSGYGFDKESPMVAICLAALHAVMHDD